MRTSLPDVLAAGDCVHTHHRLLPEPTYLPLGSTAQKQGRVAGATATGHPAEFAGSLGTQVVKVFDVVAARTGLRDAQAVVAGSQPLTVAGREGDHKAYYPGATPISMRWTGGSAHSTAARASASSSGSGSVAGGGGAATGRRSRPVLPSAPCRRAPGGPILAA